MTPLPARRFLPALAALVVGLAVGYGVHQSGPPTQASGLSNVKPGLVDRQAGDVQPQAEPVVYITTTGHRYHRAGCRTMRYGGQAVPLSTAIAAGLTPCRVCDPPAGP